MSFLFLDDEDLVSLSLSVLSSYLPPLKGVIREDAVLSGHQWIHGLIEALSEPRVSLRVRRAPMTGARPFGENIVGAVEGVLEEVERRVSESVSQK